MARRYDDDVTMSTADRNRAIYGTAIPNVEQKRAYEKMQKDALIADEVQKAGGSIPLDGINETGQRVSTMGMSDSEKFFAIGRAKDAQRRAAERQKPIDRFEKDINTSVAYGGESKLLTPEGRARAMKQAVAAGLSYEEADAAVQGAFDFLNKKYGKKDAAPAATGPSVGVPPLLARPEETTATAKPAGPPKPEGGPTTPPVPIKNEEGKPEYGPVNLAKDIQQELGIKELPEGSESAVRSAFDALSALNARYRVTPEEAENLRERQYKAKLDPAFAEGLTPIEQDITERNKLYEQYDAARNSLIDLLGTEGDFGGAGSVKDGMGRKEITQNVINRQLRRLREQQYKK